MTANDIIDSLNKKYGKETVLTKAQEIECIPTGSIGLDIAIGAGGLPMGRISEIYGVPSSGKTTLALTACKMAQKKGITPVYVDVEYALDTKYAKQIGVDFDGDNRLIITQPDDAQNALSIIESSIQNGSKFIVLDSVGALVAHQETVDEGEMGDSFVGLLARLMSQSIRRLTPLVYKNNATVLFLNQMRSKIGGMGPVTTDTPGGYALKHGTSVKIKIARTGTNKTGDESVSNSSIAKVEKNKVAPPYREAEFDILFGVGIDWKGELVQLLLDNDLIKKSGSWYKTLDGPSLGQGANGVKEYLSQNPDLYLSFMKEKYPFVNMEFYN
jgi:recombination protein RecA